MFVPSKPRPKPYRYTPATPPTAPRRMTRTGMGRTRRSRRRHVPELRQRNRHGRSGIVGTRSSESSESWKSFRKLKRWAKSPSLTRLSVGLPQSKVRATLKTSIPIANTKPQRTRLRNAPFLLLSIHCSKLSAHKQSSSQISARPRRPNL